MHIELSAILEQYDLQDFSHGEMLQITELQNRTLQVWFQRGKLDVLGMTDPGRGVRRTYSLWQVLALSYARRLAFLSVPIEEAIEAALAFAPVGHPRGRPVTGQHVFPVLPALEAAQDASRCEEKVYSLIYRHMDGRWQIRVARIEELGSLSNWLATCAKDNLAIVCDLGRVTRLVLARAIDVQRRRAKEE